MEYFTNITIDFEASHLVFPRLVIITLFTLGLAIAVRDRKRLLASGEYWRRVLARMDKPRFLGSLTLTVIYFSLMVPVGDNWPNTGLGFLICSVPYVFFIGWIFAHDRKGRALLPLAIVSVIGPVFVWWLFTELFFLSLP